MMALIDYHQPVAAERLGEIPAPSKRLERGHIDDAGQLGPTAAELTRLDAE
jgi:hypothetical protein